MKPLEFLHTVGAVRLLERASRAAAAPVAVHYIERGQEGPRILGVGQCAACRTVAALPGGSAACRASRLQASARASRRDVPVPFLCPMGFACAAMRALPGEAFVFTIGPYCPSEAPEALEDEARAGIEALDADWTGDLGELLADIRHVPASAVPEVAQWTAENLAALWRAEQERESHEIAQASTPVPLEAENPAPNHLPLRMDGPPATHAGAAAIATALAGGARGQARQLVEAALAEVDAGKRATLPMQRARAVSLATSVLEAAERAEMDTAPAWRLMPAFIEKAQSAKGTLPLRDAALEVLGELARRAARGALADSALEELHRLVLERMPENITLEEVAAALGQHPTAITHRLQRKFGLSYTEYVAQLRIAQAKELLRRTRLRINDVAMRVGISDISNFGRLFRKVEGVSPAQYRKRFANPSSGARRAAPSE